MDNGISIIDLLKDALPYARRFEKLAYELDEQKTEQQLHFKRIQNLKNCKPMYPKVILIIVFVICTLCLLSGFADRDLFIYYIGLGVCSLVVGLFAICYIKKARKEDLAERIKRYNELEESIPCLIDEVNKVLNESMALEYDFIPLDYFTTEAIQFFINAFERYLARDMHEAAVLYEQAIMRNEDLQRQEAQHRAVMQELTLLDIHVLMANRNNRN